ncbi:CAF1A domain-containing protein, partial [Cephalotus follicularis]
MADTVTTTIIYVDEEPKMNGQDQPKRRPKRKLAALTGGERETRIETLNEEMEGLFEFYRELIGEKAGFWKCLSECNGSCINSMVAVLMEESGLPLSKLVEGIYGEVKGKNGAVTIAAVKSALLFVGQRVMYGVPNVDADVLEDENEACLWCWETRDLKLMPKTIRGALKTRRICRKKIHERIIAVSAMITALQKSENDQNYKHDVMKASEKLGKVLSVSDIRILMNSMMEKNGADIAEKEAKREEKLLIKQLERNKREVEKEKKRMDRELQKEKWHIEKEQKLLQEEAEKDERRREKEESETRKQLRKQHEEAEKDQRRREKEEAELKKKLGIQKQASLMERFLKRCKANLPCHQDQSLSKATTSDSSSIKIEKLHHPVTQSMDCALSLNDNFNFDDLRKSHISYWRRLGHSVHSNSNGHWGIRWKPKTALFRELKLTTNRGLTLDDELSVEKLENRLVEQTSDDRYCLSNVDSSLHEAKKCNWRKQLLQFDKSHRPAFYGIWPKKSNVVGPRHPLRKDPYLDYDVDSDEEWEEEDPGESLSDCDKEEDESLEEGCLKADDEDENEDGFFVPDGYLSENEGVQGDRMETDLPNEETKSTLSLKQEIESEELCTLLRQQKYLHSLTEHALRKNQPLIVLNLMHEKASLLMVEDLSGTFKMEQTCLQTLSMRAFPGCPPLVISLDYRDEDEEACLSHSKGSTTPISTVTSIPDSDLPTIVSVIQSCSQGMNKVVESLQQKFPTSSKFQLRNRVREIADFVDNRWQVKKEILDRCGLSISPEKGGRTKSITTFFSKRCLPPSGTSINPSEVSPKSSLKSFSAVQGQQFILISRSRMESSRV